jgi:hypothetical protein
MVDVGRNMVYCTKGMWYVVLSFLEEAKIIMNAKSRILPAFFVLFVGMLLSNPQTRAAEIIANIASLEGEVIIRSGERVSLATDVGQDLFDGDHIQTKYGRVRITFNDGAILSVKPFTSTMIQEREEERGFLVLKGKKAVRRITCFVGKLRFETGESERRNYLQSPNSACELSGSDADFGYDNINSYLGIYKGKADCAGDVIGGFFTEPSIGWATENAVYNSLASAYESAKQAKATGKALDFVRAKMEALQTTKVAAAALLRNPDAAVAREAGIANLATDALIAANQTEAILEELRESKKKAEEAAKGAKAAGDEQAARNAEEAVAKAVVAVELTEEAAGESEKAAKEAKTATEEFDLRGVRDALDKAEKALADARYFAKDIIKLPEEVPTVLEPTKPVVGPKFEFPIQEEPPIQDTEPASRV